VLDVIRARRSGAPTSRIDALRAVPGLAALPPASVARLDAVGCELERPAGAILNREGTAAREAALIVAGSVEFTRHGRVTGYAHAGAVVGELALLDGGQQPSTTTAITAVRVLVIEGREAAALYGDPDLARWLAGTIRSSRCGPALLPQ